LVYLDSIQVNSTRNCATIPSEKTISVFPNPLEGNNALHVSINTSTASAALYINVHDANGRLLLQQRSAKPAGLITIELSSLNWPSGNYFISVRDGDNFIGSVPFIKSN
jgi:hypothetical protein